MKRLPLILAILLVFASACASRKPAPAAASNSSTTAGRQTAARDGVVWRDGRDNSKECRAVAPPAWPAADVSSPSAIAFDDQLFFTVDGQRFFPLGFYGVPTDAAGLAQFHAEGFNIGLGGGGCCDDASLQDQVDLLTRAQDAGVFLILYPWTPIDKVQSESSEQLAAELAPRDAVGSLFGWYTFDEPSLTGVSQTLAQQAHTVLATLDPTHPDALTDAPLSDLSGYMNDCTSFMIDAYPSAWIPLTYIKEVMAEAEAAAQGTKPVTAVMQAFSWRCLWGDGVADFHPNAAEMRNMTWQFIIHGAKGLIPYTYDGSCSIRQQADIWSAFLANVAELNALMGVLLADDVALDLRPRADFPTLFDYLVKTDSTATWALTVSTSDRTMTVNLDFSALGDDLCIVDYTTGEVFAPDAQGRIAATYSPWQARILEVIK